MSVPTVTVEFAPGAGPLDAPASPGDENFLLLDGDGWAETPDTAVLDLTTTLDLRAEIAPDDRTPPADEVLIGKWQPSAGEAETSWLLVLTTAGHLRLIWHDAVTGLAVQRDSTQPLPTAVPRLAVRVAGDVSGDPGALTFFTGDTVDGPWTQLGSAVAGGGNPAVASSAPVLIGAFDPDLQPAEEPPPEPPPVPEPEVVFFDDFTTFHATNSGLDPASWFVHDRPDGDEGYVNNEWQLYVPSQVTVENSLLKIRAEHTGGTGPGSYKSGLVTTAGKVHFGPPSVTGGLRVEIRLRAPGAPGAIQGLWPSLYMLEEGSSAHFGGTAPGFPGGSQIPPGWPTTNFSEVDVWEWAGAVHGVFEYHANRHWNTVAGSSQPGKGQDVDTSPTDITATFNTYGLIWAEDSLSWTFNGVEVHRLTAADTEIPPNPMFAIVNFAVGGFFPGDPDPGNYPAVYEVDWLKVTELAPAAKVSTLVDDLDPPSSVWTQTGEAGQVTVTGGGVEITPALNYPSLRTTSNGWDLTGSAVFAEVSQPPNAGASVQAFLTLTVGHPEGSAPAGEVRIGFDAGNLVGQHRFNTNPIGVFSVAYDTGQHRYWRISEAAGTVTFASSPDGTTFTDRGSVATATVGFAVTGVDVELVGGHFQAEADPGVVRFEGVNVVGGGSTPTPPTGEKPTAATTGLTDPGALTPAGFDRITTDGAVIENLEFDVGYVEVQADNVMFRNCKFIGPTGREGLVRVQSGKVNCRFEDCEVDGNGAGVGLAYGDYTAVRCHIHDCEDGAKLGDNTTLEACLIDQLFHVEGAHNDGAQSSGGNNIVVKGCSIINVHSQTSCLLVGADLGNIDNVLIEGNWLESHANFVLTVGADPGWSLTNCVIKDNMIAPTFTTGINNFSEDQEISFFDNVFFDGTPIPDEFHP